tara:strand:+ start:943 stop:1392 length:450 start_codon:yes stop_codon:yes gene_type:complete
MGDLEKCNSIDEYSEYLGCCRNNFNIILKDHKKSYINWKLTLNKSEFQKTTNSLETNVNSNILKLTIKLNDIFKKNKAILINKTKELNELKIKSKIAENLYKGENDIDNAAGTLENDLSKELLHDYLYVTFLFLGTIASSAFIIKNIYK